MPTANSAIVSLLLNIVNIVILFLVLRTLVYKPVKRFMSARSEGIEKSITEAERKTAEAEEAMRRCTEELAASAEAAAAEKRRILDAAEGKAAGITAAAEAEAEKMKDSAAVAAQHTVDQMMEDMREQIASLSLDIASRVLEREVERGDNADLIDKFFNRVG